MFLFLIKALDIFMIMASEILLNDKTPKAHWQERTALSTLYTPLRYHVP